MRVEETDRILYMASKKEATMYDSFYSEGRDAFLNGTPIEECPYDPFQYSLRENWLSGFRDELKESIQAITALEIQYHREHDYDRKITGRA